MKQIMGIGVLLLASIIGLAIPATSSASTDNAKTSCAAVEAAIAADAAAVQKATLAGESTTDYATEASISLEILKLDKAMLELAATAKTVCAASNAPAKYSSSKGLPVAILGKPYPATTFCTDIKAGQCLNAGGKLITFKTEGDLLPLGMRFNSFTGTISGTPTVGQSTRPIVLRVCSHELSEDYTNCVDATLFIK